MRYEVDPGHPEFGKAHICTCRQHLVTQQTHQRLYELSRLEDLAHLNFENFQPRGRVGLWPSQANSLEAAYNSAYQYAQTLRGWLMLQGDYGCGKTHLAAAIGNHAVGLGVPTLFITVPDLLDSLRAAFNDPETTFEERFEEIRQAPLLILDDFGTQNATPWAQEKLFQLLNFRYINHLPLVITTNVLEEDLEGRVLSRLQDPELVRRVKILAPDYRNPAGDFGSDKLSLLDLLHNRNFANFELRKNEDVQASDKTSLEKAFRAAREFAENPRGWLVIIGPYGSGKTHLAAAIANFCAEGNYQPQIVSLPDLMEHLRAAFNSNSTVSLDRRFEIYRAARILILDDLGVQSNTPWVNEKLFQLFNYRYLAELPTVITTSMELRDIDPRLRSRMLDKRLCNIYAITMPAYTGVELEEPKKKSTSRRKKY